MRLRTLGARVAYAPDRIASSWREGKTGSTARLYDYKWQQASKAFLVEHPLCMCPECDEGRKRTTAATIVDHRVPHRGNVDLFWDMENNWQAMAAQCHNKKTAAGM